MLSRGRHLGVNALTWAHRLSTTSTTSGLTTARRPFSSSSSSPPRNGVDQPLSHTTISTLTHLGKTTTTPATPETATLDRVPNAHPDHAYVARFSCPEFTSLCPVTGQPDFAHLVIDYVPADWLVESKSLKLLLASYRNHPDFHEACSVAIARRLVDLLQPKWLRLGAYWYPRGGIPIDVFYATGDPPAGVWIPEQGCPAYRGRG